MIVPQQGWVMVRVDWSPPSARQVLGYGHGWSDRQGLKIYYEDIIHRSLILTCPITHVHTLVGSHIPFLAHYWKDSARRYGT